MKYLIVVAHPDDEETYGSWFMVHDPIRVHGSRLRIHGPFLVKDS